MISRTIASFAKTARYRSIFFEELLVFLVDFITLQAGKLVEAQIKNGVCLLLAELETLDQLRLLPRRDCAGADDPDHFVEVVDRLKIAFQDMGAGFCFIKLEAGAAADHFDAVVDPGMIICLMFMMRGRPLSRASMLHPKVTCMSREFVELVHGHFGDFITFQFDDDAHTVFIGFVTQVGNACDRFAVDQSAICSISRDLLTL